MKHTQKKGTGKDRLKWKKKYSKKKENRREKNSHTYNKCSTEKDVINWKPSKKKSTNKDARKY